MSAPSRKLGMKYLVVGVVLVVFLSILSAVLSGDATPVQVDAHPAALLQPIVALVALTGAVWLLMVAYRNLAFIRGHTSERYFQTYTLDAPAEWVERPTRAFMNLLEAPLLFYVIGGLMLITGVADSIQIALAWLFVATRYVHAFIYIAFNYIPLRFVAYASGVITLGVMWVRFAAQTF